MKTGSSERPDLPLAVVIGAGGMGMATARRLGTRYRILLVDVDSDRADTRAAAMRDDGHDVTGFACDITDADAVGRLADAVAAAGPFRVLAHVAGLSPSMGGWESILRVNLRGAVLVETALRAHAGLGTAAIFISSLAAHAPAPAPQVLACLADPLAEDFLSRIEAAAGQPLLAPDASSPRAPGTLVAHYAPSAKVRLMPTEMLRTALKVLGAEPLKLAVYSRSVPSGVAPGVVHRRMPAKPEQAAHELFSILRELDREGVHLISVEEPPPGPEWDGVRDRLSRAAAS